MHAAIVTLPGVTEPQPPPWLAESLRGAGWAVTVLRLPDAVPPATPVSAGAPAAGIDGIDLDPTADSIPLLGSRPARLTYRVDRWLRRQDGRFDAIHFPLSGGTAFYAALARRQGLAYCRTALWVWVDMPTFGRLAARGEMPDHPDFIELDFLERHSLLRADAAVLASAPATAWCRAERWQFPERCVEPPADPIPERLAAWHVSLQAGGGLDAGPPGEPAAPPVSVCLIHHDRPHLLGEAVESLRRQNYPNFEVVLLDDGSRTPAARSCLAALEPEFEQRGWRIIRQENRYLGAARNAAAEAARGDYLLFMDDDDVARPDELSVFTRAMRNSGADVLTCFMDLFRGVGGPPVETGALARILFLGGALGPGLFRNLFGNANAFIRRPVFLAGGGFTEDRDLGAEDAEYLAGAALAGYRVEVVPEALVWYRVQADSMSRVTDRAGNELRRLRPYKAAVPPELRPLVDLAYALGRRRQIEEGAAGEAEAPPAQQSPPPADKLDES